MAFRKCEFGQLEAGDTFFYHDQLYRKDSELSAILIRWASGEEVTGERVTHRFFPEILVDVQDDTDEAS